MATGFLIGESLLTRIKTSLDRQDGQPVRIGDASIPTRLQDVGRSSSSSSSSGFKICTFTGAWSKSQAKTVTFRGASDTVSATNLFTDIPAPSGTRNCAIAKDGTAWYLVAAECD